MKIKNFKHSRLVFLFLFAILFVIPIQASAEGNNDVVVSIGEASGAVGEVISVPVKMTKPLKDIAAYNVDLQFDKANVQVVAIKPGYGSEETTCTDGKEGCFSASFDNGSGSVKVIWIDSSAGDFPLKQAVTLFTVQLQVKSKLQSGSKVLRVDNLDSLGFYTPTNEKLSANLMAVAASASLPPVKEVVVKGTLQVDATVSGSYLYPSGHDAEGQSEYKWYRADDQNGLNKQAIKGAQDSKYTFTSQDLGKYISFEVTPVTVTGETGVTKRSAFVGPVQKGIIATSSSNGVTKKIGTLLVKSNTKIYKMSNGKLVADQTVKKGQQFPVYAKEAAVYRLGGNVYVDAKAVKRTTVKGRSVVIIQQTTDLFTYNGTGHKKVRTLKKGETYYFYEVRTALYYLGNGKYIKDDAAIEFKK